MSHKKWKIRIRHILESIARIQAYTKGMDKDAFQADLKTLDAVIRHFQVIGEAAKLVPEDVKERHPEIPWKLIRGMRNILVHAYDQVNVPLVWKTSQTQLPPLVPLLSKILETEAGE